MGSDDGVGGDVWVVMGMVWVVMVTSGGLATLWQGGHT